MNRKLIAYLIGAILLFPLNCNAGVTEFIASFWESIKAAFVTFLNTVFSLIGWVFYCIFDGFLAVVFAFFDTLDLSVVAFDMAASWSDLPPQLIWLIVQLSIPQCLTIITGAIGVRLLLNIIPASLTRI